MDLQYRKDIDGLRAVAVLLVVIFHVHPRQFTGGFVGVDVFFVISGFLITGLIQAGLRDGSFSLLDFYARRVRRIFPALILVLVSCLVLGWFVLFPADYQNLGRHVAASAAFVANFTLLQDAGYFDAPSELKPALHLWSLGIEEQFYLLWPALMLLAWHWRRGGTILAWSVLAASFAVSLWLSSSHPVAAFFHPAARFWELMIGGVLALGLPMAVPPPLAAQWNPPAMRDGASVLGLLLIGAAAVLINRQHAFPGTLALLPTVGAALLIAAGPGALVNRLLLSRSAMVQLGLISYPLYLWHWPILAFLRHFHFKEPSDLMRWGGIGLAVMLAGLTYRFVERPIRRASRSALLPIGAVGAMAAIGLAGIAVFAEAGYKQRFASDIAALFNDDDNVAKVFVGSGLCAHSANPTKAELSGDCDRSADSHLIVVWGDSHGSNITRGLAALEQTHKSFRLIFFNTVGCPPSLSYTYTDPTLPNCAAANRLAIDRIGALQPQTVILAGNWAQYDGGARAGLIDEQTIRAVVDRLKQLGVGRVVGLGQYPRWDYPVPKLIARDYRAGRVTVEPSGALSPIRSIDYLDPRTQAADQNLRQWFVAAGADFVSPLAKLCDAGGCLLTVPGQSAPMDRDTDHMTNAGAIWFAQANADDLIGRR